MQAIEILEREHRHVHDLLRCLGALTVEARVTGALDGQTARSLLRLLEDFVDRSHQDKEELHLFPHMLARATAEEARYLTRVFDEHAQERRRLVGMLVHLEGASRGTLVDVERFVANALLYVRLQQKHVEAEDEFVLPLAETILTPADDRRVLAGFRRIDARRGAGPPLQKRVAALCRRFGLEPAETRVVRHGEVVTASA